MGLFCTTGQVTPKSIVWSGQNSLVRDFTPVQMICKSHNPIKTKKAMLWTVSIWHFFGTQGQVTAKWIVRSGRNSNSSEILWLSWLPASLKMIWSKVKALSSRQHFLHHTVYGKNFCRSRASNSKVNGLIWPKIELVWDFMDVLVICKYEEDPIKNEVAIDQTTFSPL